MKRFGLVSLFLFAAWGLYAENGVHHLSRDEFQKLAEEIAPRVNLFREIWRHDTNAEFVAGTSRDFLYWVKHQFEGVTTREQAIQKASELKALSNIDVRDFVIGQSDVDIIARYDLPFTANQFGIRKFDKISSESFRPGSRDYQDAIDQGFLPVERIRLTRQGFKADTNFGDGLSEIYSGKPTLTQPTSRFEETHYAKQKLNHPVLLALRYLRILAVDYYRKKGRGAPDSTLFDIDPQSRAWVEKTLADSVKRGALSEYLKKPKFVEWLNGSIQKAFRSYTNPTAARELFRRFGGDRLVATYSEIDPINQYLFAEPPIEPEILRERFQHYKTSEHALFVPTSKVFPDGYLYHGTRDEQAFLSILREGILPSTSGSAGAGLYGVDHNNIEFASNWGGSRDRIVKLTIAPDAKIVDISQGEGKRLFKAFGKKEDEFARHFGIDILIYPYTPKAYVVKNSTVLSSPKGLTRDITSISKMAELAKEAVNAEHTLRLMRNLVAGGFREDEMREVVKLSPYLNHPENEALLKSSDPRGEDFLINWHETSLELTLRALRETKSIQPNIELFQKGIDSLEAYLFKLPSEKLKKIVSHDGYAELQFSWLKRLLDECPWATPEFRQAIAENESKGAKAVDRNTLLHVRNLAALVALSQQPHMTREQRRDSALEILEKALENDFYLSADRDKLGKLWSKALRTIDPLLLHELSEAYEAKRISYSNWWRTVKNRIRDQHSGPESSINPYSILGSGLATAVSWGSLFTGLLKPHSEIAIPLLVGGAATGIYFLTSLMVEGLSKTGTVLEATSDYFGQKANVKQLARTLTEGIPSRRQCSIAMRRIAGP